MIALAVGLVICVVVLTALAQTGHLRRWWQRYGPGPSFYRPGPGFRGINVVQDGPAEGVPEPGGLPGAERAMEEQGRAYAEALTPFSCPAIVTLYPEEPLSEAQPATCDLHGRPLEPWPDGCDCTACRTGHPDGATPHEPVGRGAHGVTDEAVSEERARMDAEHVAEIEALLRRRPKGYRAPGTYR